MGRQQSRPWRFRFAGQIVFGMLLLLTGAPGSAQTDPCPPQLSGSVSNPPAYQFSYQSWIWRSGTGFRLGNCVKNTGRRPLFVDWQGASLRTFVPAGESAFSVTPRATGRGVRRLSPLFYGARPTRMTVPTVFPIAALTGGGAQRALWDAGPSWRALFKPSDPAKASDSLQSFAKLFVPSNIAHFALANGTLSQAKLTQFIEENPDALQPFSMEFTSTETVTADGRLTISYNCSYRTEDIQGANDKHPMTMRFADPALHRAMFNTDEGIGIGDWWLQMRQDFSASVTVAAGQRVRKAVSRLDIYLADEKTLIGSLMVQYSIPTQAR